ncbi:MAG: ClpXP protease specificity-enhancing factor SspB [Kiloniellaceae bacterium]
MSKEGLRYDRMVEDALRSVVRRALIHVAEHGLPGNHHFYITFRTDHPDVDIPPALQERYPGEMTIVLQHQFWGLEIDEQQFCVTLSFSDVPHRLVVPFSAVTAFADPSVRFGLQFDVDSADIAGGPAEDSPPFETPVADSDDIEQGQVEGPKDGGEDGKPESGKKVVTLDAFRKK